MSKHLGRSLVILAALVLSLINLYPTLGWYRLNDEQQQARIEKWRQEEIDLRREGAGTLSKLTHRIKKWSEFDRDMVINLGLDLQGGVLMVLGFDMTEEMEDRDLTEEQVQDIVLLNVTNRINDFEAKEPIIQALGTNQIQIQLPGQKDIQRAKDVITQTAHLGFHMVAGPDTTVQVFRAIDAKFNNGFVPFLDRPSGPGAPFGVSKENFELVQGVVEQAIATPGLIPDDLTIGFSPPPKPWEQEGTYEIYLMDKVEKMSGEGLTSAYARPDDQRPGNWMVIFEFGGASSSEFATLTEENIGREMGIVVDGNVMSAPTIQSRIPGTGNITGTFTADEAKDLSIVLNSGSLPVAVREEYAAIVGASMGQDAVRAGVLASLASVFIVALFMVGWYRFAGLIADVSLAVNALLIVAAFAYFDITLTLPGIAGLVLTIGMAVDANVLIYERIREEQSLGKSMANSISAGFEHAMSAIIDSNVTTIIAAFVLMQFGTGAIQGFAVALSIGVVCSVFAALVVSRALLEFTCERGIFKKLSMVEIIPIAPQINFLGKRRIAVGLSFAVIAIGVGMFVFRGQDNFGVDFNTGTNARVHVASEVSVGDGDVRSRLQDAGFAEPSVQKLEATDDDSKNVFLVRVGESEESSGDPVSTRIQKALLPLSGNPSSAELDEQVALLSLETVGPAVGAQLRTQALEAVLYAIFFIVAYIWFRFEWKYALGSVIALGHDVLVVVGLFALFGEKITIPVIAAIMTIIGFSLNDTIVVFDRVREDLALNRSKGLSFVEGMNLSLNRTLSRTLLTSLTVLFVVVVLYFSGGESLQPFSLAMILGVTVGTYSSIYIASPVVIAWHHWAESRKSAGTAAERAGGRRKRKEV